MSGPCTLRPYRAPARMPLRVASRGGSAVSPVSPRPGGTDSRVAAGTPGRGLEQVSTTQITSIFDDKFE